MTLFKPVSVDCTLRSDTYFELRKESYAGGPISEKLAREFLHSNGYGELDFVHVYVMFQHVKIEVTNKKGKYYVIKVQDQGALP